MMREQADIPFATKHPVQTPKILCFELPQALGNEEARQAGNLKSLPFRVVFGH